MSIEKILKDLNTSVIELNASVQAFTARIGSTPPVNSLEDAEQAADAAKDQTLGVEGVKTHIGEEPEDSPDTNTDAKPLTLKELGAALSAAANKYGAAAQDAIKEIIMETGGTQALSQVDPKFFGTIGLKVAAWVKEQE